MSSDDSNWTLPVVEVDDKWKLKFPNETSTTESCKRVGGAMACSSSAFCTDHPAMSLFKVPKAVVEKGPESLEVFDAGYDLNIPIQHPFARSDNPAKNLIVFDASASEVGKQYWAKADSFLRPHKAPIWGKKGEFEKAHIDNFLRCDALKNSEWNIIYFSFTNQKGFGTLKQEYTEEDCKAFFEAMSEFATALKNDEWTSPEDESVKTKPATEIMTSILKGFCGVEQGDLIAGRKLLILAVMCIKLRAEQFLNMYNGDKDKQDFTTQLMTKFGTYTAPESSETPKTRKRRDLNSGEVDGDPLCLGSRDVVPSDPTDAPNYLRGNLSTKYSRGNGALIASGGGIRAMMFTSYLYFLLQDIIPIVVSEMYGLSGSTWAMGLLQFYPPTQALVRALKATTDFVSFGNMFKSLMRKDKKQVMRWWRDKIDCALLGSTPATSGFSAYSTQDMKTIDLISKTGTVQDKYKIRPIITAQAIGKMNNEDFTGWVEFRPEGMKIIEAVTTIRTYQQRQTRNRANATSNRGIDTRFPNFGTITVTGPSSTYKFKIHENCQVNEEIIARAFGLSPGSFYLVEADIICGFDMVEDGARYQIVEAATSKGIRSSISTSSKSTPAAAHGRQTMDAWDTLTTMSELGDFIGEKWQDSGSKIKKLVNPLRKLSIAGVNSWSDVKSTSPEMWAQIGLPTALKNLLIEESKKH